MKARLNPVEREKLVEAFRQMLDAHTDVRAAMYRPMKLGPPNEGWDTFLPGNTLYIFIAAGESTPFEENIAEQLKQESQRTS